MRLNNLTRLRREKGSALLETTLCLAFIWTPLFFGTYQVGFNLIRQVQVTQICRDAGHMYSMGADFSQPQYQNLLQGLMPGSMTATSSGNTVLYMSTIEYVDASACQQGGLTAGVDCPNYQQAVFTRQIPVGNTSLSSSSFGTPSCPASNGYNCSTSFSLTNPSAIANGFLNVVALDQVSQATGTTQYAYMSEMFVQFTDLTFFTSLATGGNYARSVF